MNTTILSVAATIAAVLTLFVLPLFILGGVLYVLYDVIRVSILDRGMDVENEEQ